jgi:caffeoyl-CoA O-methyltransferase
LESETLKRIDSYIEDLFGVQDAALKRALEDSRRAGLPEIQVSPNEGKLLYLLAKMSGARRVLEIGTLGGYSTIWLARALPAGGRLVSLELDEHHAEVARNNLERAGLSERVEVRVGDARESLADLHGTGRVFDLVFIDADKEGYPEYLEWSLKLSRPGTVILADNVIRGGTVLEPEGSSGEAVQRFNRRLAEEPRLEAVLLPVIRERVDGIAVARVVDW